MSLLVHYARDAIRYAGESGSPVALAMAADLAGRDVTPEQVKRYVQIGLIPGEPLIVDPADSMSIAKQIVAQDWAEGEIRVLHHHAGQFYEYRRGCYRPADPQSIRAGIWQRLADAKQIDRKRNNGDLELKPVKPTQRLVNDVLDALRAACNLHQRIIAPSWLEPDPDHPPADEVLSMSNGLLHLPTRTPFQPTPLFWTHSALPFAYRPEPDEPVLWLRFLCEVFQDDPESIDALQEWFGLMLLPDTGTKRSCWSWVRSDPARAPSADADRHARGG